MASNLKLQVSLQANLLEWQADLDCSDAESFEYAVYLYKENERIKTFWYTPRKNGLIVLNEAGIYKVEVFARRIGEENLSFCEKSSDISVIAEDVCEFLDLKLYLEDNTLEIFVTPKLQNMKFYYAFTLRHNEKDIEKKWFSRDRGNYFILPEKGDYKICVSVALEPGTDFYSQTSETVSYYQQEITNKNLPSSTNYNQPKEITKILKVLPCAELGNLELCVKQVGETLACEIKNLNGKALTVFLTLLKNGQNASKKLSREGKTSFIVKEDGIYQIKCNIISFGKRYSLESDFFTIGKRVINPAEYSDISLAPPAFTLSQHPFLDFCVIFSANKISKKAVSLLDEQGFLVCREAKLGNNTVYLIVPKSLSLNDDILLSGFIYERVFVYGQQNIKKLPEDLQEEKAFSEMTGTFTAVKFQEDSVVVSSDLFGAGHLYCFEDKACTIVSNRLHFTLLAMQSLKIKPQINENYIAANLCFDEKMISITNFTTDLIYSGLRFLPLNQYVRFSAKGTDYPKKSMNYEKIPFDKEEYCRLLDQAKEDIVQKLDAIAQSGTFGRYIQEVTGGFDSRVSLAATLNCPEIVNKMRVRTIDVDTSQDLKCSLIQTNYYKLPYYDRNEDPVKVIPTVLEKNDEENRSLAMGLYRSISVIAYPRYHIDGVETICFGGYFGETMRSRYFGSLQPDITETDSTEQIALKIAKKFALREPNDLVLQHEKSREAFVYMLRDQIEKMPGKTAAEKFDNMYTFFHLRFHFGLGEYQKNISNTVRLSPFMSKYMLYASKMLTMNQRYENKIMYEMAHWLKPEIIVFPYSSYGLQDSKVQFMSHKNNLMLKYPDQLEVSIDTDDYKFYAVEEKNKEYIEKCEATLARTESGVETRQPERFVYLRMLKLFDSFEQVKLLDFFPWDKLRKYVYRNRHVNAKLQPLYCNLMGIHDQLNIVLNLFKN